MRPAQKSNRSRGRGNRKGGGGGGGNNITRVFDSAGPEGKVRGTPQQIIDKYLTLARDAQTSGDRVTAENFLQHAEHYQRILILAMGAQEQNRREQQSQNNEQPDINAAQPAAAAAASATSATPDETDDTIGENPAMVAQPAGTGEQPAGDIGGMAMIDAAPEQPSLLVESDDISKSRPRRNGKARPPKPEAVAEAPASTPEEPPEAAAEG